MAFSDNGVAIERAGSSYGRYSRLSSEEYTVPFGDNCSISSELLKTAILPGSTDIYGNPLVIFLKDDSNTKSRTNNNDDIIRLLLLYNDVTKIILRRKRLAFLSETGSDRCNVLQHLNELERRRPGSVAIFYLMKPKSDSTTKKLKKMLGLKTAKQKSVTFVQLFKTVTVNSLQDLHKLIDPSQLTTQFGGNILYDHQAWNAFFKDIFPSIRRFEDMLGKLEGLKDRSFLLQEYDTRGHSSQQLKELKQDIENNFKVILRGKQKQGSASPTFLFTSLDLRTTEDDYKVTHKLYHCLAHQKEKQMLIWCTERCGSGFIECLENCKKLLHNIDQPPNDNPFCHIYGGFYLEVSSHVRNVFLRLTSTKKTVCSVWAAVDEELETDIEIKQRVEETEDLCMKISETFWPLLSQHPCIGSGLTEVEKTRNQFTNGLYNPAKDIIHEATVILEMVKGMQPLDDRHSIIVKELARRLKKTVDPFAKQLGELNKLYTSVHIFHLVFQKCFQWYKKVLYFIPKNLCMHASRAVHSTHSIPCPGWWFQLVHDFLQKYPAPKDDQISLLDSEAPPSVDQFVKTQALMLSSRIRVMVDILMSSHIETVSLCNVLMWKKEEESGSEPFVFAESPRDHSLHQGGNLFQKKASTPMARLKRRLSRSKTMRSEISARMYRSLPRVSRRGQAYRRHQIRRSSSTDTELRDNDSDDLNYNDFVPDDDTLSAASALDNQSVKSMPSLCERRGSKRHENDEVVDKIQRVASSKFIDNNTKLRYVTDLVCELSVEDTGVKSTSLNKGFTKRRIAKDQQQTKELTPAQRIAALNSRLSRSLENIINFAENDATPSETDQSPPPYINRPQSTNVMELHSTKSSMENSDNVLFSMNLESSNGDKNDDYDDSCPGLNKGATAVIQNDEVGGDIYSLENILEYERQKYRMRKAYHQDAIQPTLQSGMNSFSDESNFEVAHLSSNSSQMNKASQNYDDSQEMTTSSLRSWSSDLGYGSQAERARHISDTGPVDVNDLKNEWRV